MLTLVSEAARKLGATRYPPLLREKYSDYGSGQFSHSRKETKGNELSTPVRFFRQSAEGEEDTRGWNYHKDTENTEFKFKKIEEFGVSGGLHEIWSQRGDRFQCNGTPGTAFKSEKERFSLSWIRPRPLRITNI
jgi:hypothetical protein